MTDTTEIYICRNGDSIRDGNLYYSHEIGTRRQAEKDAYELCMRDHSINRVAYYKVDETGRSRLMMAYAAPDRYLVEDKPTALALGLTKPRLRVKRPKRPPELRPRNRACRWMADLFYVTNSD